MQERVKLFCNLEKDFGYELDKLPFDMMELNKQFKYMKDLEATFCMFELEAFEEKIILTEMGDSLNVAWNEINKMRAKLYME